MLYTTITGKDQGRVMDEITADYEPKHGVSYGHTFSEGSADPERMEGVFAIAVQHVCYRVRSYGLRANSFSGVLAFETSEHPDVGCLSVTSALTNIDDYVYEACMETVMPAIERACEADIEVRQIMLSTHKKDTTNQMSLSFQEEEKLLARYRGIDAIKNRFGQK